MSGDLVDRLDFAAKPLGRPRIEQPPIRVAEHSSNIRGGDYHLAAGDVERTRAAREPPRPLWSAVPRRSISRSRHSGAPRRRVPAIAASTTACSRSRPNRGRTRPPACSRRCRGGRASRQTSVPQEADAGRLSRFSRPTNRGRRGRTRPQECARPHRPVRLRWCLSNRTGNRRSPARDRRGWRPVPTCSMRVVYRINCPCYREFGDMRRAGPGTRREDVCTGMIRLLCESAYGSSLRRSSPPCWPRRRQPNPSRKASCIGRRAGPPCG